MVAWARTVFGPRSDHEQRGNFLYMYLCVYMHVCVYTNGQTDHETGASGCKLGNSFVL
jgi:hypothetical protein